VGGGGRIAAVDKLGPQSYRRCPSRPCRSPGDGTRRCRCRAEKPHGIKAATGV